MKAKFKVNDTVFYDIDILGMRRRAQFKVKKVYPNFQKTGKIGYKLEMDDRNWPEFDKKHWASVLEDKLYLL